MLRTFFFGVLGLGALVLAFSASGGRLVLTAASLLFVHWEVFLNLNLTRA